MEEKPDKPSKPHRPNKPEKLEKPEPKATPTAPTAPNPKRQGKEGKGENPKDKSPLTKEEKAKTPCLFSPTGTCFRTNCPYLHDTNNPHPNPKTGAEAKAKPAAAPKGVGFGNAEAKTSDREADNAPVLGEAKGEKSYTTRVKKALIQPCSIRKFIGTGMRALMTLPFTLHLRRVILSLLRMGVALQL